MYGKTLEDFPDRPDAFLCALADMSEADINAGFELAVRILQEFPVPAHIRQFALDAARDNHKRLTEESRKNQRLIEDRIKDERFEETSAEERRNEFAEMVAEAARKIEMAPAPKADDADPSGAPREIPPNIAAAKGPEWEARIRRQAEDLKRQAGIES